MEIAVGQVIKNRYRVDKFLGRGGMASVYQVWDEDRATPLAMKVLHDDLSEDVSFVRRFKGEASILAELKHPHIVRFYEFIQDSGTAMILMDYIDGTTLRTEISNANEPLSIERTYQIVAPVCSALHFAHKRKLVHCDVKPANIMLRNNGDVLLSDFGIAMMTEGTTTATVAGFGAPAYMAPEQILGKNIGPWTDIYALGITIYEMITGGERPFNGSKAQTSGSTGAKVRWEKLKLDPPSPSLYNRNIPGEVEQIVLKCLARKPSERFPSAMSLFNAMERATSTIPGCHSSSFDGESNRDGQKIKGYVWKEIL